MKVKLQAVQWQTGPNIPLDDFCAHFAQRYGAKAGCTEQDAKSFAGYPRIVFAGRHSDYWLMLMLTLRGERTRITVKKASNGALSFTTVEPDKKSLGGAEFNYLMIHKKTGLGIYSTYAGSSPFDKFTVFFKAAYDAFKKQLISEAVKSGSKSQAQAEKHFRGRFGSTPLLTRASASK